MRPGGEDWRFTGPAYVLDVIVYGNPDARPLRRWVEEHAIDPEALAPPTIEEATVAGEPAVLVRTFGGDSEILTWCVGRGTRVVAPRFADVPFRTAPSRPSSATSTPSSTGASAGRRASHGDSAPT